MKMGSEHLNWILENVNKFILKEETKSDLPSWKIDINNDFGQDLVEYEDGILLTPLVRLTYLRHLRYSLKNNYLQCHKGIKDCSDMIVRRIENCATLMEQKALRLCMITSFYQRTMNNILSDIKSLTGSNLLHKELGRCLCSDYLSVREDKNIQADIHPVRLSRGVQTSDHKPWTETDLDTLEAWRVTKLNSRTSKNFHHNSLINEQSHVKSPSTRVHVSSHKVTHSDDFNSNKNHQKSVPNRLSDHNSASHKANHSDLPKALNSSRSHHSSDNASNLSSFDCIKSNYNPQVQGAIVKQIIDDYTSNLTESHERSTGHKRKTECEQFSSNKFLKGEGVGSNTESFLSPEVESKTYDSLDDRLQEMFAEKPTDNTDQLNVSSQSNQQKPWEEIMKDLLGSDDDDFPLDSQEIEELSRGLSDNEPETSSLTQSPAESEECLKGKKKLKKPHHTNSENEVALKNIKVDEALLNSVLDPNVHIKSHFVSWLSERVAQVCYFNSLLQRMNPEKRKALEKKFVSLFGPCCMFDNDDFSEEEQTKICRKRIAKIVCHHLRPFFRSKQIGSKDLFQIIARHITEQLLNKHMAADEEIAKKSVDKFFERNGKIKCADQLPFLLKPKASAFDAF